MTEFRKADPASRKLAVVLLLTGTGIGALLIGGFDRYHGELLDWILVGPESAQKIKLALLSVAALQLAPLLALALYLWSLGERVRRSREFPPPGLRVLRDTPIVSGEKAIYRARLLRSLALTCGIAAVALCFLFWRVALLLGFRWT